jgi:outer membrane receptor protein involved in Fe transport
VPIAVEAFTAADITNSVITSDTDLGMLRPGLVSAAQFGYFQPHLRGVGTTAPSASVESPVAVYVDGVYYGSETGSIFQLAGIERIEVDKGPKGTLFGRNATGGLIQIITKDPDQQFSGTASVTAGDYQTLGGSHYVTGGITPTIASNASVYYQNQGQGYGRNVFNGEDVNRSQDFAIRQKILFTPIRSLWPSISSKVTALPCLYRADDLRDAVEAAEPRSEMLDAQPQIERHLALKIGDRVWVKWPVHGGRKGTIAAMLVSLPFVELKRADS